MNDKMRITYKNLRDYIYNSFVYDDGSVVVETDLIPSNATLFFKMSNKKINTHLDSKYNIIPYLRYVYFPIRLNRDFIDNFFVIDFTGVDFSKEPEKEIEVIFGLIDSCFKCYKCIELVESNKHECSMSNNPIVEKVFKTIQDELHNGASPYNCLVLSVKESFTKEAFYAELKKRIHNYVENRPKNLSINLKSIFLLNGVDDDFIIIDSRQKLKKLDYELTLVYYSPTLAESYKKSHEDNIKRDEALIADIYYFGSMPSDILDGYEDFRFDYNKYQEVFDIVCNWIEKQPQKYNDRYLVPQKVGAIQCIELLFAWITLVKGVVFVFNGSTSYDYSETINNVMLSNNNLLPPDVRYELLLKQPTINDKLLLGTASLSFGGDSSKIAVANEVLVGIKSITHPAKRIMGIPLNIIFNEIKSFFDEDAVSLRNGVNKNGVNQYNCGFFVGKPVFTKSELAKHNPHLVGKPLSTIDVITKAFVDRCEEITNYIKSQQGYAIYVPRKYYEFENYDDRFNEYLYCFQSIFNYYAGFHYYTINDIYIFNVLESNNSEPVLYACVMEYNPRFEVHLIDKIGGEFIIDNSPLTLKEVNSPRLLTDYCIKKQDEHGFEYPEINPDIISAIKVSQESIQPVISKNMNESIKANKALMNKNRLSIDIHDTNDDGIIDLEFNEDGTLYSKMNDNMSFEFIDVQPQSSKIDDLGVESAIEDSIYPVVYINSGLRYGDNDNDNLELEYNEKLNSVVNIYMKELIYYKALSMSRVNTVKYMSNEDTSDSSLAMVDGLNYSERKVFVPINIIDGYGQRSIVVPIEQKIIHELCDPDAVNGRRLLENSLSKGKNSYKGLRFLNPSSEKIIEWTGKIVQKEIIPPAIFKN